MMRTTLLCTALLLSATSGAWAGEIEDNANTGPTNAPNAPSAPSAPSAPQEQAVAAPEAPAPNANQAPQPVKAPAAEVSAPLQSEPQPYKGWGRGVRPPIYVTLMMTAGAYGEDGSNRLTTRDSKILEGVGGVLRIGAVFDQHHRLGGRLQSFVRPTKKILLDTPADATSTDQWGSVTFGYIGPEYLYSTNFGLYAGGSIGLGGVMSTKNVDRQGDRKNDHIERGSGGVAGILSLGYEWRANKWFALSAELYGGLYHGIDDNENSMNGSLFGVAMGAGF